MKQLTAAVAILTIVKSRLGTPFSGMATRAPSGNVPTPQAINPDVLMSFRS